jgi:hypothetical protein
MRLRPWRRRLQTWSWLNGNSDTIVESNGWIEAFDFRTGRLLPLDLPHSGHPSIRFRPSLPLPSLEPGIQMPEHSVGIQSKLPDANRGYLRYSPGSCLSISLGLLLQGADHGSACPDFRYRGAWSLGRAFHSLIHILRQPSRFVRTTLHATSLLVLEMKGKAKGKIQIRYLPHLTYGTLRLLGQ